MSAISQFRSEINITPLTDVFLVMAAAIVISGVMMIWLSDHVAEFLKKNRMYEVLGLFILFIVAGQNRFGRGVGEELRVSEG